MIEIIPSGPVKATCSMPGCKYLANRALIIAALADGETTLHNIPDNEDINTALQCIHQFGAAHDRSGNTVTIQGTGGTLTAPPHEIDVRASGTFYRFITALSALANGKTAITGTVRLRERPVEELLAALGTLGVRAVKREENKGVIVDGGTVKGGQVTISGKKSSQFISALLLVAPYAQQDITIDVSEGLSSSSFVDLTCSLMKEFGVSVRKEGMRFSVKAGQRYISKPFTLPGDWSSANYLFGAAAITNGEVTVTNLDTSSPLGEATFVDLLGEMGCAVRKSSGGVSVTGTGTLRGISRDLSSLPDAVQTLAAVALFSEGETKIRNIGHLRYKESDRIKDTATELRKLGAKVEDTDDGLVITPRTLHGALVDPHQDHRLAMSLALVALKQPGLRLIHPGCVSKSFPGYWDLLTTVGVSIGGRDSIVLIGYRGTGKTFSGNHLGRLTGYDVMSTDEHLERRHGPLPRFIEEHGWDVFREAEKNIIGALPPGKRIIDCGGGVVEDDDNIKKLQSLGIVVWLTGSPSSIASRIRNANHRPSLTGAGVTDEIADVLERRIPLYRNAADMEIATDGKTPEKVAEELYTLIREP